MADTTPPVFVGPLPVNLVLECSDDLPAVSSLTAVDACSEVSITFEEDLIQGSCSSNYDILRKWTARDSCGNASAFVQTISIRNTTPPIFLGDLPQDIRFSGCELVSEPVTLTAIDECGEVSVLFEEERISGDCTNQYTLVRTWTAVDSCGNSLQHKQRLFLECDVVVHNALSPNEDGFNDYFHLEGIACFPNTVQVFNRWGIAVYKASGYNNLDVVFKGFSDGRSTQSRGSLLPVGTYFYIIEYTKTDGRSVNKSGYLYINY